MKVLILCTGNSCRSQMAEGFLRRLAGDQAEVVSAGLEAHGLHPKAIQTMADIGIDISNQTSDLVTKYLQTGVTHVITVCDHAAAHCPHFPEQVHFSHVAFADPAKAGGTEAEIMSQFAQVRDQIASGMQSWWALHKIDLLGHAACE